jgi:hypothetical protein
VGDAGVVDQDVDAPEGLDGPLDQRRRRSATDVALVKDRLEALRARVPRRSPRPSG